MFADDNTRNKMLSDISACLGNSPLWRSRGIDGGVIFVRSIQELAGLEFDYIEYMEGMSRNSKHMMDMDVLVNVSVFVICY